MRYELQSKSVGAKINVFDIANLPEEKNAKGEITKAASVIETKTDKHAYSVVLNLVDTDSLNKSTFQHPIMVEVSEKLTGKEVEEEIEKQTAEFLKSINQ